MNVSKKELEKIINFYESKITKLAEEYRLIMKKIIHSEIIAQYKG